MCTVVVTIGACLRATSDIASYDTELATVKAHVSDGGAARAAPAAPAEALRLQFAEAWGEMSASWGVAPAIGRVHAYLMVRDEPLTEREIREALGLSHRAASLALADAETWGIVERVSEPRRVGRRGPGGHRLRRGRRPLAVVHPSHRRAQDPRRRPDRRGDRPDGAVRPTTLAAEHPGDAELAALRDWLAAFNGFVRLFDRAVGLIPKLEPRELERGMRLLGEVSDETVLRLVHLLGGCPTTTSSAHRSAEPPLADRRPPGDEADVGGRPDGRPLVVAFRVVIDCPDPRLTPRSVDDQAQNADRLRRHRSGRHRLRGARSRSVERRPPCPGTGRGVVAACQLDSARRGDVCCARAAARSVTSRFTVRPMTRASRG